MSCRCQATPPANRQRFGWYFPRQQVVFQASWPLQGWGSGEATPCRRCYRVKYCKYKEDVNIELFIRRQQKTYGSWWRGNRGEYGSIKMSFIKRWVWLIPSFYGLFVQKTNWTGMKEEFDLVSASCLLEDKLSKNIKKVSKKMQITPQIKSGNSIFNTS